MDALGCTRVGVRRVRLASGQEEEWPVGAPPLLGAVTLEEFALGVDPTAKRLVPVTGYLVAAG